MTGTTCNHLFHYDCAMEWLANHGRPKDYCPYCRTQMMTPTDMREAAVATLGEERVQALAASVEIDDGGNDGNQSNNNDTESQ